MPHHSTSNDIKRCEQIMAKNWTEHYNWYSGTDFEHYLNDDEKEYGFTHFDEPLDIDEIYRNNL